MFAWESSSWRSSRVAEQIEGRDAVGDGVMCLGEHREPVAVHTLDEPHLQQRLPAVELLRHDACSERFQLLVVSGVRDGRVPDVVAQVEVRVVRPHRAADERHPCEPLAMARHEVQPACDVGPNALDVDAAARRLEWARLEQAEATEAQGAPRPPASSVSIACPKSRARCMSGLHRRYRPLTRAR